MKTYTRTDGCSSHCVMCDLHFASDSAFNAHLAGPSRDFGHFYPEDVKELRIRTTDGVCKLGPSRREGITLWEHGPSVDRVRERIQSGDLSKKG